MTPGANAYHKWVYENQRHVIHWRGHQIQKPPEDLWMYSMLIQTASTAEAHNRRMRVDEALTTLEASTDGI